MKSKLSKRLNDIVQALPLKDGVRVLEIGCGPGAMAREDTYLQLTVQQEPFSKPFRVLNKK